MDENRLKDIFQKQLENHETDFDTNELYKGIVRKRDDDRKSRFLLWFFLGASLVILLAYIKLNPSADALNKTSDVIEVENESNPQQLIEKGIVEIDHNSNIKDFTNSTNKNVNDIEEETASNMMSIENRTSESKTRLNFNKLSLDNNADIKKISISDSNLNSKRKKEDGDGKMYSESDKDNRMVGIALGENMSVIGVEVDEIYNVKDNTRRDIYSIPFIPINELDRLDKPLFDGEDMEYNLPLLVNRGKVNPRLRVGVFTSIFFTKRRLEGEQGGVLDLRNLREKSLESVAISLSLQKPILNHFYLETGLEYLKINELFAYSAIVKETQFIQSKSIFTTETIRKRIYNSHQLIEIPIGVGYMKSFGNWSYNVSFGANVNLSLMSEGQIMVAEDNFIAAENQLLFNKKLGMNYTFSTGIGYQINDIRLCINSRYKRYTSSFSKSEFGKQTYNLFGGEIGVLYQW